MSITLIIIILTAIVSITAFNKPEEMDKLLFWPAVIHKKKQYYRFISSGFVHANWTHLLFNMITLYFFGRITEQVLAINSFPGSYVGLYLLSMIAADIPTYFRFKETYEYRALGASGAVSGVLFASILYAPWEKIYLFFIPIGIPAFIFGLLFLLFSAYMDKKEGGRVNHNAHLWGALFGIVYTLIAVPGIGSYFLQQVMSGGH